MHVTFILTPTATTRYAEWLQAESNGFYSKPHGRRLARPQPALAALLPDEQRYGDDMLPCGVRGSRYMGCGGNGFVLDGNVLHVAGRREAPRRLLDALRGDVLERRLPRLLLEHRGEVRRRQADARRHLGQRRRLGEARGQPRQQALEFRAARRVRERLA